MEPRGQDFGGLPGPKLLFDSLSAFVGETALRVFSLSLLDAAC
jgi:hypothetical protein